MYVYVDVRRDTTLPDAFPTPFPFFFSHSVRLFRHLLLLPYRELAYPRSTACQVTRVCGVPCDPPTHKHPVRRHLPDVNTHGGPPRDTDSTSRVRGARRKHLPRTPTPTFTITRGSGSPTDPGATQAGPTPPTSTHGPRITRSGRTMVLRPRSLSGPWRMGKSQSPKP